MGVSVFIMMLASDYNAYTTEIAIVEAKGEEFDKSFSPMWESFTLTLLFIIIAFLQNQKRSFIGR